MSGRSSLARRLDLVEQVAFLLLFAWLTLRIWPESFSLDNLYIIMLLISEGIVVALLVVRRRTENISLDLKDWALAVGGTFFGLLVVKGGASPFGAWQPLVNGVGIFLLTLGLLTHTGAKLSLRRSFGLVAADRGVKAGGMYRYVRHPMYLGYMLCHIGYLLSAPVFWNLAVYALSWSFLIARIFAEERILSQNPEYRTYMDRVQYRLLPGLF